MTTKAKEPEPVTTTAPPKEQPKKPARPPGLCVVDDGTPHFADGRVIPGTKICSAHEIHYFRDGSRRVGARRG